MGLFITYYTVWFLTLTTYRSRHKWNRRSYEVFEKCEKHSKRSRCKLRQAETKVAYVYMKLFCHVLLDNKKGLV